MVRWEPDERAVEMYVSLLYNAIMRERATAELEEGLAAAASSQLSLQAQVDLLRETVAALEAQNAALCADRDGAVAALADAEIEVTSERRRREAVETLVSELQLDLQCRGDEANDLVWLLGCLVCACVMAINESEVIVMFVIWSG